MWGHPCPGMGHFQQFPVRFLPQGSVRICKLKLFNSCVLHERCFEDFSSLLSWDAAMMTGRWPSGQFPLKQELPSGNPSFVRVKTHPCWKQGLLLGLGCHSPISWAEKLCFSPGASHPAPQRGVQGDFQEAVGLVRRRSRVRVGPSFPGFLHPQVVPVGCHRSSEGVVPEVCFYQSPQTVLRRKPNFPHQHFLRGLCFIWRTFGFAFHPFEVSYYQGSAVP